MRIRVSIFSLAVLACCLSVKAGDWPAFRGPTGDGICAEKGFPTKWGSDENIKWKVELPDPANGSPIVSNGHVFLTCCSDEGKKRSLYCYDRKDGKQLWVKTVEFDKKMPTHKTNPYGGSTPVADGKRVVVWHQSAGLYCYDMSGKELWSRNLGEFEHIWGYGGSPVIHEDRIILNCGPGERNFVTAIKLSNGETIWETVEPREGKGSDRGDGKWMGSWSTPVIAKVDGKYQIVCTMSTRVNGYEPMSGDVIWSCDGIRGPKGDLAYSSPMINDGFCVAIGGYGGPSIGFKLSGKGNLTETNREWRFVSNPQSIGTGIFLDKHVYRANAAGPAPVQCLDPRSGKVVWDGPRNGGICWGSMVLADGLMYVTNQNGATLVFKANPNEYKEVARNELRETCNSTPAFSDGEIFIRTHQHLYCIGK